MRVRHRVTMLVLRYLPEGLLVIPLYGATS